MKSFYKEDDEAVPVNVYGKSKVAAEQFITEKCSNFAILRSSIIFGPQTISPVPKSLPIQVHKEKTDLKIRLLPLCWQISLATIEKFEIGEE